MTSRLNVISRENIDFREEVIFREELSFRRKCEFLGNNNNNFIPFFTSYNQFMYNVKNLVQPPGAGMTENGASFGRRKLTKLLRLGRESIPGPSTSEYDGLAVTPRGRPLSRKCDFPVKCNFPGKC